MQSIAHARDPAGAAQSRLRRGAPAAGGRQVPRHATSAAATTTTRSRAAACRCFRAWSPPSTVADVDADTHAQRHRRRSTTLLGGGLERAPARCSSARRAPASRRSRCSSRWPPRERGERAALFIFDESVNTLLHALRRHGHGPRAAHRRRPHQRAAGRSGRAVARANSSTRSARPSRSTAPRSS